MNISNSDLSNALQQFIQDTAENSQNQTSPSTDLGSLLDAVAQPPASAPYGAGSGSPSDSVSISLEAQMLQAASPSATNPLSADLSGASSSPDDSVSSLLSLDQQVIPALPPDLLAAFERQLQSAQTQDQPTGTTADNPPPSVNTTA
ncbi:MAG: hypothetical protein KGO52_02275 [Nitrospirota bacterium]|nr:hypothetical protein [Nitrospirota bacterium]MDE3119353.1 hypothetical protein [Nitrospirota bacterium]MDE3241528.1 hypothetical protein [Nitrospirota bacterium]